MRNFIKILLKKRRRNIGCMTSIVDMRVPMNCEGCQKNIRKALKNLRGVESVEIDMENQKVTVTGYVDQLKVLRKLRKMRTTAVLWSDVPENIEYYGYAPDSNHHHHHQYLDFETCMYYDDHDHHAMPHYSSSVVEKVEALFSEENTRSCSIM